MKDNYVLTNKKANIKLRNGFSKESVAMTLSKKSNIDAYGFDDGLVI